MTVDPGVIPGLLILAAELLALAAVGYVVARVALRQSDDRLALAQGLIVGPALWGLTVNFLLHVLPWLSAAIAGWVLLLILGTILTLRADRKSFPVPVRTLASFVAATLAIFWVALAARQMLGNPDPPIHFGLAASFRSGTWPPVIPWIPHQPVVYHYGADLLIALLAPPTGPDLAFTTELFGAFVWTAFVLTVATTLLRFGGWLSLVTLTPLILSPAMWTLLLFEVPPPDILQIPFPLGLPEAGLRSTVATLFWPDISLVWQTRFESSPPNILVPHFVLSYAIAFIVFERLSTAPLPTLSLATLAFMAGFLGLLSEEISIVVLTIWAALIAWHKLPYSLHIQLRSRIRINFNNFRRFLTMITSQTQVSTNNTSPKERVLSAAASLRPLAALFLAIFLLAAGGGPISALLAGTPVSGISIEWIDDPLGRRPFGTVIEAWPGGLGLLGLGVLPVSAVAVTLAFRHRLALVLVCASLVFMLAAMTLQYSAFPADVTRMDGHARNFALLALLISISTRVTSIPAGRRALASIGISALITWPTIATPIRTLSMEIRQGIELANSNAASTQTETIVRDAEAGDSHSLFQLHGRQIIRPFAPERIADYIRRHTSNDARILSPYPHSLTAATGRPNSSGFAELLHLIPSFGPKYLDAIRYLEPASIQDLEITYIHAPDVWVSELPDRARRWLDDPTLFDLLIRDDDHALYRVRPAFMEFRPSATPPSFRALGEAVAPLSRTYLSQGLGWLARIRLVSGLSQPRVLGTIDPSRIHSLTEIPTSPLGANRPDFVAMPLHRAPAEFRGTARQPVWWNQMDNVAVYAPDGSVPPLMPVPPHAFRIQLSDTSVVDGLFAFTATFTDHAPDSWTGQDWLVTTVDSSPWALPNQMSSDSVTHQGVTWFAGQVVPGQTLYSRTFQFDSLAGTLEVKNNDGSVSAVTASGQGLGPGTYTLLVRLQRDWREVGVIPIMKITVSSTNDVTYQAYEGVLGTPLRV